MGKGGSGEKIVLAHLRRGKCHHLDGNEIYTVE